MEEKKLISEEELKSAIEELIEKAAHTEGATMVDGVKLSSWVAWIQWRLFEQDKEEPRMPDPEKIEAYLAVGNLFDQILKNAIAVSRIENGDFESAFYSSTGLFDDEEDE